MKKQQAPRPLWINGLLWIIIVAMWLPATDVMATRTNVPATPAIFSIPPSPSQDNPDINIRAPQPLSPNQTLIESGTLSNMSSTAQRLQTLDHIGLLTPEYGGLKPDAFDHSNPSFIRNLIITLPDAPVMDVAYHLKRRILLSQIKPLASDIHQPSLFLIRLKHLARDGHHRQIKQLLEQIEPKEKTDQFLSVTLSAQFVEKEYDHACRRIIKPSAHHATTPFWMYAQALCYSYHQQFNKITLPQNKQTPALVTKALSEMKHKKTDRAQKSWKQHLFATTLSLPIPTQEFPPLPSIYMSPLSTIHILSWWNETKNLPPPTRLDRAVTFYNSLEAIGGETQGLKWEQLFLYGLSHHIDIPPILSTQLIRDAVRRKASGEVALLVIHTLGNHDSTTLPKSLMLELIIALKAIGLNKDAKKLALDSIMPITHH